MNTQRLYYEDPYLQLCEAEVLAVNPIDEAKAGVILSRTCFFPRGGGAQGDTGSLGDVSVSEAITDRLTGMILHLIAIERRESLGVGERVVCRIDWNTRYRVMRLHSASHVMEHYLFELARGLELVGTNLNEERDSSTYSADPCITDQMLLELNRLINDFLSRQHTIRTYPDQDKPFYRYWECAHIRTPCGGVHPRNTSEIGQVRVRKTRGGKRQELRTELIAPGVPNKVAEV